MTELPSGTVTFLFTDIEESTKLLRTLGDGYADLVREHRRILSEIAERSGGVVSGDSSSSSSGNSARSSLSTSAGSSASIR